MKKLLENTNVSRKDILKFFGTLAAFSFLPKFLFSNEQKPDSVHFIGLGGAGSNQVESLFNKGIEGKFTCISNPVRKNLPSKINFIHFIPPGKSIVKNGKEICHFSDMQQSIIIPDSILNIFESNDIFVLLSGLGGYTGTYMTESLTLKLNQLKKPFITITSLPFNFEGPNRKQIAEKTLVKLESISNFHYYELEQVKMEFGNLSMTEAFGKSHDLLFEIYKNNSPV
jgi:cell division GTPase FtsZ